MLRDTLLDIRHLRTEKSIHSGSLCRKTGRLEAVYTVCSNGGKYGAYFRFDLQCEAWLDCCRRKGPFTPSADTSTDTCGVRCNRIEFNESNDDGSHYAWIRAYPQTEHVSIVVSMCADFFTQCSATIRNTPQTLQRCATARKTRTFCTEADTRVSACIRTAPFRSASHPRIHRQKNQ